VFTIGVRILLKLIAANPDNTFANRFSGDRLDAAAFRS
jgi:hypothetical protein